jgi:DNA-binding MarR family transcriptional regulator
MAKKAAMVQGENERPEKIAGPKTLGEGENVYRNILKNQSGIELSSFRLARELFKTQAIMMAYAEEYLRPYELSWSKLNVLFWLRAYQQEHATGLAPSELSTLIGVGRNTVSTLLEGLERQGFISRELDPADKRRFIIRLKASGETVTRAGLDELGQRLAEVLRPLGEEQRALLTGSLIQFREILVNNTLNLERRT